MISCPQVNLAIILAGGRGTRLQSIVPNVPKSMAPINGRPFLEYLLDYWISQGVCKFILSVGYLKNIIIKHFGQEYRGTKIRYALEEEPLGTGGGLLVALENVPAEQSFLVLNGDTFFAVPLPVLLDFHRRSSSALTFSLFRTTETKRYLGVTITPAGKVISLQVKNSKQKNFLANGGVYLVESPTVFSSCGFTIGVKVSLENNIFPAMQSNGTELFGCECSGEFIDIGIPHDYFYAQTILAEGYNEL